MRDRRAQWNILTAGMLLPTGVTWVYFMILHGTPPILQHTAYALLKGAQFALPIAAVWCLARRELWHARFHGQGVGRGIVFGILVAILVHGVYEWLISDSASGARLREMIWEKIAGMGLGSHARFIFLACFYSIVHSGLEEYYWRWFVFRWARRLMRTALANIVSSLGFMLHHVLLLGFFFGFDQWETWVFSLAVAVGGAFWAWLYQRTGSLLAIWVSHAIVDAGIFSLGYVLMASKL